MNREVESGLQIGPTSVLQTVADDPPIVAFYKMAADPDYQPLNGLLTVASNEMMAFCRKQHNRDSTEGNTSLAINTAPGSPIHRPQ